MMVRFASTIARSGCTAIKNAAKVGYVAKCARGRELKQLSSFLPILPFNASPYLRRSPVLASSQLRVYNVAAAPLEGRSADPPKEAHGFELMRREYVKEYDSDVLYYVHKKTGAEVLSVVNDDENKCFGVEFRTPVSDSTGVPHILEHSVLCGSRKYPVKEPFVEMIKGSLNTFLNAMTFPDRTCYPIASCNLQDFYNLMNVYLDAVFFPNCVKDPLIFAQEGWHYEVDKETDPLTYKGVVFNEMKGSFSSPDMVHYMKGLRLLFPENTYTHESGGHPASIPDLTFEQFREYHGTYYHPSNAKIWISGDDDPVKRLEILSDYLEKFEKKSVESAIEQQPFFKEPKKVVESFAAGEKDKAFVSLHWLLSEEPLDIETRLNASFLNYLLVGTTAAPLYKRLIDSNLGEAVTGSGLETSLRQPTFGIGLKGVDLENVGKVEEIIIDELKRLAKEGFTQNAVDAALNTIEFSLRENNTGRYPRGLSLMLRAMEVWNYDQDPVAPLKWEVPLQALKNKLASGTDVFGKLLHELLLDNKHRLTLELQPDREMTAKMENDEREKLLTIKAGMSEDAVREQVQLTEDLKRRQRTPDSPEDLKCIPLLKLSDIPKETPKTPTEVSQEGSVTFLRHDLFTNDILYFNLAMDMRSLPADLIPMVVLFCDCLTEMGTESNSFIELTELIGRKTGGLGVSAFVSNKLDTEEPVAKVLVTGKATKDKVGDLMEIAKEILLTAKLDDKERFKQMVLESKADLEASINSSGHSYVVKRLGAQQTIAGAVTEQMSGISHLSFLRDLADRIDNDWASVQQQLEDCRKYLIRANDCVVNLTADKETMDTAKPFIDALLSSLPKSDLPKQEWDIVLPAENEAFTVPTQVNYIGKGVNLYKEGGYELSGTASVITKHLYASWLWERVRVTGGAYGCMTSFDRESGNFTFVSYRDPNLLETVDAYDKTPDFLQQLEMDEDSLTKAIIGAIGDVDAYQLPDGKGRTAMIRHFLGVTDEWRQERRNELLATSTEDFNKFGKTLEAVKSDKAVTVAVTTLDKAEGINKEKPGFWKIHKVL